MGSWTMAKLAHRCVGGTGLMKYRVASVEDCPTLATLNAQLIQDEGHRNPMTVAQLEDRMRGWLTSGAYQALLWEDHHEVVAYALFRETADEVYLRQFFVVRHRRREGIGRQAIAALLTQVWPRHKRWTGAAGWGRVGPLGVPWPGWGGCPTGSASLGHLSLTAAAGGDHARSASSFYDDHLGRRGYRMKRRELMLLLGGAMMAARALRAQQK